MLKIDSPLVSVDWLQKHFEARNLVILDASIPKVGNSDSKSYPSKRIKNSLFFDLKNKFSNTEAKFPNTLPSLEQFQDESRNLGVNSNSAIVVYDDKGIYSSARVWWLFKVYGHQNIAVLDGGLPEWEAKGFETESYTNKTSIKGNFIAKSNPNLMTDFEGVNHYSNSENALIFDARSRDRFNCKVPEPRKGLRSGTIPNSINLPYTEILNGNVLKTKKELKALFKAIDANAKTLVFSCGSGITACNLALAATIADYEDVVVYDGSWTEYGTLIK